MRFTSPEISSGRMKPLNEKNGEIVDYSLLFLNIQKIHDFICHAPDQSVNRSLSDDPTDHSNRIPAYIHRFRR